ncbi:MAG: tetratricopeptide repeat protein, partial [Sneathiella sp.]
LNSQKSVQGERVAEAVFKSGDYQGAAELYYHLIQAYPESPAFWGRYADSLYGVGDAKGAIDAYRKAAEYSEDPCLTSLGLGRSHLKLSRPVAARVHFETCLAHESKNIEALKGLAITLDLAGLTSRSHVYYKKAIRTDPSDIVLQNNYGLSLMLAGQFDKAITVLSALAFGPKSTVKIRQNLALAFGLQGDDLAAEQILSLDFSDGIVRNNLQHYKIARHLKGENGLRYLLARGGQGLEQK